MLQCCPVGTTEKFGKESFGMKKKYIGTVFFSLLLLLLFLPVFFYVIYYGSNIDYNEMHKIVTVEGNRVLCLCAIVGAAGLGILFYFLRKLPATSRAITVFTIVTVAVCVLFYIINVNISKCIAFYGGWDCGMVANSARWIFEGGELGYDDYYTIYSNNIPITWLLYKLYCISSGMKAYPYNPEFIWIQFQCVMLSLAVLCSVLLVLRVSKNLGASVIALIFNIFFLGISPWKIIPYTDGCTIAMPVMILFLYSLFRDCKSRWRYFIWFLLLFLGCLSGIMKATCYVAVIAIVIIDIFWTVSEEENSVRSRLCRLGGKLLLLVIAFCLAAWCRQGMYRTLHYEYNKDLEIGWSNYMYNGLNEDTTGACSGEGLEIVRSFAGSDKAARMQYELEGIRRRMQDRGLKGTLRFWLRKQVMNFNDGTFSWYQEGYFQAWEYPELTDSSFTEPLRNFYWQDGSNYIWFTTISQGLWIFVLLGILAEAALLPVNAIAGLRKHGTSVGENSSDLLCVSVAMIVTFIGMFLFVMLFEARARYLYNMIPVFSTIAVLGWCELYRKLILLWDKKRR